MKVKLLILIHLIMTVAALAQNVQINNIIATDYVTTDDDVLEVKFVDHLPNLPFIVAWIGEDGKQYALQFITTEDKLVLPLNGQQGWSGTIGLIGLSLNNVEAQLRQTTFNDQWRLFMMAYQMTPGSVNFTQPYQLFGYAFRWICLGVMFVLWILIALKIKKSRIALLISFIIAWSLYDIRSMKNRWDIMTYLSGQDYEINILEEIDVFLLRAREIIGDSSWSKEPLSGVLNSYCTYQLADLPYIPLQSGLTQEADYIITTNPANRKIVFNHGRYFLVERNGN